MHNHGQTTHCIVRSLPRLGTGIRPFQRFERYRSVVQRMHCRLTTSSAMRSCSVKPNMLSTRVRSNARKPMQISTSRAALPTSINVTPVSAPCATVKGYQPRTSNLQASPSSQGISYRGAKQSTSTHRERTMPLKVTPAVRLCTAHQQLKNLHALKALPQRAPLTGTRRT